MASFNDFFKKLMPSNTKSSEGNWITTGSNSYSNELTELTDDKLLDTYRGWVYSAVNAIAEEVANIEFKLLKKKGENVSEIKKHPVLDLLNYPNDFFSKFDLFLGVEIYLLLLGKAYIFIERAGNSPSRLWLLNAASIETKMGDDGFPKSYYNKTTKQTLSVDDVIEFRKFSPFNVMDGFSPMQAGAYIYDMLEGLDKWGIGLYQKNAGILPFAVLIKDKVSKTELERVRKSFESSYAGKNNAFKTLFLSGNTEIKEIGKTPKDLDISGMRKAVRDEILGIFRVPKVVVGLTEDVNRATAYVSDYVFARRVVRPEMRRIVNTLTSKLGREFGFDNNTYIWFKNPEPKDAKEDAEIKNLQVAGKGWKTINEVRAEEGLSEIEGGDVLPAEYISLTAKDEEKKEKSEIEKLQKELLKIKTKLNSIVPHEKKMLELKKKFKALSITRENKFKKVVEKYASDLQKRIEKNITGIKSFNVKKAFENVIQMDKEVALIIELFSSIYEEMVEEGMNDGLELLLNGSATINDIIRNDVSKMLGRFALEITDTTKEKLLKTLNEGLESGETLEDLSKRVKSVIKELKTTRSDMIARSEVNKLVNYGRLESYKQNGVTSKKWLSAGDNRTRDAHLEADGQTVPINAQFKVGGELLDYPGDPSGSPENIIHCRCSVIPVFEFTYN